MTPWQPTVNGNVLARCLATENLEECKVVPNPRDTAEADWAFPGIREEVERAPESREALQECVVAIWRLKIAYEDGAMDEDWQNHVIAWMVRIHDSSVSEYALTDSSAGETSRPMRGGRNTFT